MAMKRRRDIPVDFVCSMIDLSFCCVTKARDSTGQDDTCITLAGITDTEYKPMPGVDRNRNLSGFLRGQQVHKVLGRDGRGRRILSGNETAINDG